MNIALIAHDSKKELMVQFCIAYCRVLSQHDLCATGTTGKLVAEATGLRIQRFLSGTHGGDQQIAARIACNEIDLLLFFRDPISAKPHEPNEMNLLRLCDVHNIPIATNIAMAWSAAIWTGAISSTPTAECMQKASAVCRKCIKQTVPRMILFIRGTVCATEFSICRLYTAERRKRRRMQG